MTDRSVDRQHAHERRPAGLRPMPVPPRPRRSLVRRLDSPHLYAGQVIDQRPGHMASPGSGPPDAPDQETPPEEEPRRQLPAWLTRRRLLAGAAGTLMGGAVAAYTVRRLTGSNGPTRRQPRASGYRASDAGGFANRDESFASATHAEKPVDQSTRVYPTAGEAAAGTQVVVPTILATDDPSLHLLRRMTFGPTPESVAEIHTVGIDEWLAQQLDPTSIPDDVADQVWAQVPMASMAPADLQRSMPRYSWDGMVDYGKATMARQIWSNRQLYEAMVDFWANHLNVAMPSGPAWDVGASYHNDVIRQHALGSFTEMLLAAMRHPAMLRYLTNAGSTKTAVNENLGRELLELHTVGVASGYTEDDVRNSAYILTGRSVTDADDPGPENEFRYDPTKHWTGAVTVLDFQDPNASPEGGLDVGDAYVRYLASHPATAQTIARKLAVRFVSDAPPQSLVDRMATTFQENATAIVPVLDIMFRSAEFWAAVGQKTRRPLENLVASMRILGVQPGGNTAEALGGLYWMAQKMGHRPLAWRAPDGYPDVQGAWRSASGLLETWNSHRGLVEGWQDGLTYVHPRDLAADQPQGTVGEYVDGLCRRLCFQTFQPQHQAALVAFVGTDPATPTERSDMDSLIKHVTPLVLDAPYFALR